MPTSRSVVRSRGLFKRNAREVDFGLECFVDVVRQSVQGDMRDDLDQFSVGMSRRAGLGDIGCCDSAALLDDLDGEPHRRVRLRIVRGEAELIDLLALCSALTANALPSAGAAGSANAIAAALGLDMADWWEPTAEGYLNHLPKAQIIAALKEAGPELAGGGVDSMKKDALVTAAASRLAGTRWLPEPLRRSPG